MMAVGHAPEAPFLRGTRRLSDRDVDVVSRYDSEDRRDRDSDELDFSKLTLSNLNHGPPGPRADPRTYRMCTRREWLPRVLRSLTTSIKRAMNFGVQIERRLVCT
jgi:hypothetical protein